MEFLNEKCRKTAQKTQNKIKYLYTETKICVIIILTKIITARGDSVIKKEMIAMLLAGGQGSRLGVLTKKVAKPAVSFGGKYRIIDFPLSSDTVSAITFKYPYRNRYSVGSGQERRRRDDLTSI